MRPRVRGYTITHPVPLQLPEFRPEPRHAPMFCAALLQHVPVSGSSVPPSHCGTGTEIFLPSVRQNAAACVT
ncbi:hypothetical protein BKF41_004287 [Salmonella enterica subsp. arizonae serovar 48:z4,z24:-]|nr:hypothetical protein [Salmonella enterica subsp. arizonae serovar 48:z4,z24:-]